MDTLDRYIAMALQTGTHAVSFCKSREEARERMRENLGRTERVVTGSCAFSTQYSGEAPKLIVLPEYFLTGFPMGSSVDQWRDLAALEQNGPEYAELCGMAQRNGVYLAGNCYEIDPAFAELFFQTCFIIDPSGNVILRYRRMISMNAPTPFDVWEAYLDRYGEDGVFPVADTPIGRLAAIASEEILYPEIARAHAVRGAEIFVHPTSEAGSNRATGKELARRARAVENIAYVVSANSAWLDNIPIPSHSCTGMSKIVDFEGHILAEAAPGGESMVAHASIDLAGLRARRGMAGMTHTLARVPMQAFASTYAGKVMNSGRPLLDHEGKVRIPQKGEFRALLEKDIKRLTEEGVL
ncbi:MAG: nitrilase [Gammaproteobacteria bacterium]|nr:nitrilase [Gammaproteobacteria bacterium]